MASELPLGGSVVQRLQRYGTYGHLKQVILAGEQYLYCEHRDSILTVGTRIQCTD